MIDSKRLKQEVKEELIWNNGVDASRIKVSVEEGKVILNGTTPTLSEKSEAERTARHVKGIQGLENEITVEYPPSREYSDVNILNDVKNVLEANAVIDSSGVEVSVLEGVITLEGSVDSFWKKQKAESLASEVSGVKSVVNKLSIVPTQKHSDEKIAEESISVLSRSAYVDVEDVDVKVKDG